MLSQIDSTSPRVLKIIVFSNVIILLYLSGCRTPDTQKIESLYRDFDVRQDQTTLEKLIESKSDGATRYKHRSLIALAMVEHPDQFREFIRSTSKPLPSTLIEVIDLREKVFEYFPEHKPENFSEKLDRYYADWDEMIANND